MFPAPLRKLELVGAESIPVGAVNKSLPPPIVCVRATAAAAAYCHDTVAPLSCAAKLPLPLPAITVKPAVPALENDEPEAFPEDSCLTLPEELDQLPRESIPRFAAKTGEASPGPHPSDGRRASAE